LKILCCYADDGFRAEAAGALAQFAPSAERVKVEDDYGYWEALSERWDGNQALAIIEQDNVITEAVIPSFAACGADWCSFAYQAFIYPHHAGVLPHVGRWIYGLGCVSFSAAFQRRYPIGQIFKTPVEWRSIDRELMNYVLPRGAIVHDHGDIQHLHDYTFAARLFDAFGLWAGGGLP
jgi:hypothetical protein